MMELAVTEVSSKCRDHWYIRKDRVFMGAAFTVILPNRWLKKSVTTTAMDTVKTSTKEYPKCMKTATDKGILDSMQTTSPCSAVPAHSTVHKSLERRNQNSTADAPPHLAIRNICEIC